MKTKSHVVTVVGSLLFTLGVVASLVYGFLAFCGPVGETVESGLWWKLGGGLAALGIGAGMLAGGKPAPPVSAQPPTVVTALAPAGGTGLVKCPYCAEEIRPEAVKCRFCGEMVARGASDGQVSARTLLRVPAMLFFVAGGAGTVYFLLYFDTSVALPRAVADVIGAGRIHNIGLMQERQIGLVTCLAVTLLGAMLVALLERRTNHR